jgi:Predicted transcriptional regulator, contains C-terminal CBS domains
MKVKYWMTKDPVTIGPDAPITEAARLMKERQVRRLPVMDDGRLVGLVTYRNILEAQPSSVSTLSKQEARYLVAKMKVSDVMRKNPITVSPEDDVLSALMEGNKKGLGCYPVVAGGHLVGIVTATDLFDLIVQALGAAERDNFVYLNEHNERLADPSYLSRILTLLAGHGITLLSFLSFPQRDIIEKSVVFLKLSPGRRDEAVDILNAANYNLLN